MTPSPAFLRTFLRVLALGLTLASSVFLLVGNLGLSPAVIANLSSTRWDYNLDLVKAVSAQAADTWVGLGLILLAFVVQLGVEFRSPGDEDSRSDRRGVLAAIAFSVLLFLGGLWLSTALSAHSQREALDILQSPRLGASMESCEPAKSNGCRALSNSDSCV